MPFDRAQPWTAMTPHQSLSRLRSRSRAAVMASKRARLPGRRFAWTQYAASYAPSPAHGSGSIAQRPRRAQTSRLRSSKSPWTTTSGDGCLSSRSTAFLAQASRPPDALPSRSARSSRCRATAARGGRSGIRRELELPEERRHIAGVGVDCGVARDDSFEQKRAESTRLRPAARGRCDPPMRAGRRSPRRYGPTGPPASARPRCRRPA